MVTAKNKPELDYTKMRAFFSFYVERFYSKLDSLPPEHWPLAVLEASEKQSPKKASQGLRQAVNDCLEMSLRFDHAEVEKLDTELHERGIVTLSEMRRLYSKGYAKIVKRGRIRNDTEYHHISNLLHDPTEKPLEELELLEKLISDYEELVLPTKPNI
jgi:hypothetical protein